MNAKGLTPAELEVVHAEILNMLVLFDKFCRKHELTYWIEGGTLLGAVRHNGFIPWDDDGDVSMPRKDFQRFLTLAKNNFNEKYFIQDTSTDPAFKKKMLKIRLNGSLAVEIDESDSEPYHQGIFIDVLACDFLPAGFVKFRLWYIHIFRPYSYKLKKDRKKVLRRFVVRKIASPIFKGVNYLILLIYKKLAFLFDGRIPFSYLTHHVTEEAPTLVKDILPVVRLSDDFCGYNFLGPKNVTAYLTSYFGSDFMKIPSAENRMSHLTRVHLFSSEN